MPFSPRIKPETEPIFAEGTVGAYLTFWLDDHVRRTLTRASHIGYEQIMRNWWIPAIGHVPMSELTADQIQAVVTTMKEKPLAATTIKVAVQHLRSALSRAMANRLIDRNPATAVRLPRRNPSQYKAMSQDEARRFIMAALVPSGTGGYWWYGPMLAAAVLTGMRAGELRGLIWGNIDIADDFEDEICGVIQVRQQVASFERSLRFSPPKSAAGIRDIPVSKELATILDGQRRRLDKHALRQGSRRWADNDLVFPNKSGGAGVSEAMRHTCRRVAEMADVEPLPTMISLRHTFASIMVDSGVPPHVVAEMLGHADVQLTVNTYYDMTPPAQRAALAAFRKSVGPWGMEWD